MADNEKKHKISGFSFKKEKDEEEKQSCERSGDSQRIEDTENLKQTKRSDRKQKNKRSGAWIKAACKFLLKYPSKVIVVAAVLVLVFFFGRSAPGIFDFFTPQEGALITRVESSIRKIENTQNLNSVRFIYNDIVPIYRPDSENISFYVSYHGEVTAGIDFSEVRIESDPENPNRVIVKVPEVKIFHTDVDVESLDFMDMDYYKDEKATAIAHEECRKSLRTVAEEDSALLEKGRENAIQALRGLVEPFIDAENEVVIE